VKGGTLNSIFTGALAIDGGELLIVDGKIAGAIGVSGGSGAQDGASGAGGGGGAEVEPQTTGGMPRGMSPVTLRRASGLRTPGRTSPRRRRADRPLPARRGGRSLR
jgi:hypothetical protein